MCIGAVSLRAVFFADQDLINPFCCLHRKKLQEWREAKGISYKRPPLPVKPPAKCTVTKSQPLCATMKGEDEAHALICAVDRSLADCVKLLGEVLVLLHVRCGVAAPAVH